MNLSTITRLPICPRPNPQEESLTNYCLRVSELNGYRTPQMLLTIAGLGRRVNVAADAADKLGPLLNVDRTVLKEMAYAHRPHDAQAKWKRGQ